MSTNLPSHVQTMMLVAASLTNECLTDACKVEHATVDDYDMGRTCMIIKTYD